MPSSNVVQQQLDNYIPRKENGQIDYRPRKHHGWNGFVMVLGFLLPPLAVAARFGFGKDFLINCVCTICGYFPGHGHNFFVQNIRNNDRRPNRTPKWAIRYGLVDDAPQKRLAKKRQWVGRYNDRVPERTFYDDQGRPYVVREGSRKKIPVDPTLVERDQYYGPNPTDDASSSVSYERSLRRSESRSRSRQDLGDMPGAGEVDVRHAKKKGGLFGRGAKKDRHARTEDVMGDAGYQRSRNDYSSHSYDGGDADEGPEDADPSVGKRYGQGPSSSKSRGSPSMGRVEDRSGGYDRHPLENSREAPQKDILEDNHQF